MSSVIYNFEASAIIADSSVAREVSRFDTVRYYAYLMEKTELVT